MKNQASAYNKYMKEAGKVNLSSKYKKKVREGEISLENVKNEKTAKKINKYQEYYDKANEAAASFIEAAEQFYNLPLDKAATKIEIFSKSIELLEKRLDNAIGYVNKNTLVDSKTKKQKDIVDTKKTSLSESNTNLGKAKTDILRYGAGNTTGLNKKQKNQLKADLKASNVSNKDIAAVKEAVDKGKQINLARFKEGSKAYNAAVKYNEALKAQKKSQQELNLATEDWIAWQREASKIKFDNVAHDFENQISLMENSMESLDNKISEIETSGAKVHANYYESQKKINNDQLAKYKAEKAELKKYLAGIKKGTDEWYDAQSQIADVDKKISDCVKTTYDLNNAINQTHFDLFDNIHDEVDRLMEEQDFLRGLFSHEKMTDAETGNFTDAGYSNLASLSASYYASNTNAANSKSMVDKLQYMKDNNLLEYAGLKFNSFDDLEDKREEFYDKWRDDIQTTYDLQSKIADAMKEKYEAQLDMLQDLINDRKDALQYEKDLHDYQNNINEKTKNISTIQKQMAAYKGDSSQEGMAKLQKLQKELADAEKDLKETEYDRYISDQQDMIDKMYEDYEKFMEKKLDDFQTLVKEGLETADANAQTANDYLLSVAKAYGYSTEEGNLVTTSGNIKSDTTSIIGNLTKLEQYLANINSKLDDQSAGGNTNSGTGGSGGGSTSKPTQNNAPGFNLTTPPLQNANPAFGLADAKKYIAAKASKAKKAYADYSDVNKKIYKYTNGKVLSDAELKELTKNLGVSYNNASSKGNLYKKLKSIKFPGFSKGGVVSVDSINRQIRANGDDGLASVKNGEVIIAPADSANLKALVGALPKLNYAVDTMYSVRKLANMEQGTNNAFGDINLNIDLPNVTNPKEFIRAIQADKQLQKAIQQVSIEQLAGINRLGVKNIK